MKKVAELLSKSWTWLRIRVVFSKTLVFIWGLVLTNSIVSMGVVSVLMDYISDFIQDNLRTAAKVSVLQDGLSSVFVVVTHVSESYAGRFNVILLCTAAYVIGLMLLWISAERSQMNQRSQTSVTSAGIGMLYVAVILIALGKAGQDPTLMNYFGCQLNRKVKPSIEVNIKDQNRVINEIEEDQQRGAVNFNIWWNSAWITGAVIIVFWVAGISWPETFKITALFMAASYLWFYCGCFLYDYETPSKTPFYKVFRVFKAALWKFKISYPCSAECYYWKNQRQSDYYQNKVKQVQLRPRVPRAYMWLDKAAIIRSDPSNIIPEMQEINGELCTVQQVREVKRFLSLTHFAVCLLPYGLLKCAGSTFFVEQANNLKYSDYIVALIVFKYLIRQLVMWLVKLSVRRKKFEERRITIWRVGAGIISAVLCCFTACLMEIYRLSLVIKDQPDEKLSISIAIFIPQYFLLGVTNALTGEGFAKFYGNHVPKSMSGMGKPFTELVLGIGQLLTIPFLSITAWFKESINTSHLHWYYLTLGILNILSLCVYVYYSWNYAYNESYPEEEKLRTSGKGQIPENIVHPEGPEGVDGTQGNSKAEGQSDAAEATSTVIRSEEQTRRNAVLNKSGSRLFKRSSSTRG